MEKSLKELAGLVGAEARQAEGVVISGVGEISAAGPGQITFLDNPKYRSHLQGCRAAAVISRDLPELKDRPALITAEPYQAFAVIAALFYYGGLQRPHGVDGRAVVAKSARLGQGVAVGPCAVIGERAELGDGTVVHPLAFIGEDCRLGQECLIYPGAVIRERCQLGDRVIVHPNAVIGSDGFGYAREGAGWKKIPQAGRVLLEDEVEVGAGTTIDRGAIGDTVIGRGSKLDNLIQVAHNVKIGRDCAFAAQSGISGSTQVGERVTLGGQVGLVGHIKIGDDAVIAAQSGVSKPVPPKAAMFGSPARPFAVAKRLNALNARLPELYERLAEVERRLGIKNAGTTKDDKE